MIAHYGNRVLVEDGNGSVHPCTLAGRRLKCVCGDHVRWSPAPDGATVTAVEPRRSELLRHDRRGGARVMAANIDLMVVVCAARPEPDPGLIDRYCVGAEALGMDALIVFNKADLLPGDSQAPASEAIFGEFRPLGYDVLSVSAHRGSGMSLLRLRLAGRTSVLVGPSGVGKSSLVNALVPHLEARTAALSAANGEGRHTTTATHLYRLAERAGCVIDSPGVRDFRLWPMSARDIASGFREIRAASARCRFDDCRHLAEPGCAVRDAVTGGHISPRRYESYRLLARQVP